MDTTSQLTAVGRREQFGQPEWPVAFAAAFGCIIASIALAAGHVAGAGAASLAGAAFVLVALWCFSERRVERTLLVFGLYVGLLDGYVKLRTGVREVTLARDVLLWAIAVGALLRASLRGESLRLPPLGLLVVAFVFVVGAEIFNPSSPGLVQALGGVRQHLEFVPLFFLGYAYVRTLKHLRILLLVLVLIAAANGVVSYVQSTLTPEQLAGWGAGYRERILGLGEFAGARRVAYVDIGGVVQAAGVRPFGLGSELGSGAVAAAIALPGLIAMLFAPAGRLRLVAFVCAPAVALGVATSGSRSALVASIASVLAFVLLGVASRNAIRVALGVGLGLLLFLVVSSQLAGTNESARRTQSVVSSSALQTFRHERGASVAKLDEYVADFPLGLGVGTVGPASQALSLEHSELNAETEWNLIVIETGIAGLLLIALLGGRLMLLAASRIRHFPDPDARLQLAAVAAPFVALFVLCFAGPVSVSAPAAPFLWFAAGVLCYWLAIVARGHDSVSGHRGGVVRS